MANLATGPGGRGPLLGMGGCPLGQMLKRLVVFKYFPEQSKFSGCAQQKAQSSHEQTAPLFQESMEASPPKCPGRCIRKRWRRRSLALGWL